MYLGFVRTNNATNFWHCWHVCCIHVLWQQALNMWCIYFDVNTTLYHSHRTTIYVMITLYHVDFQKIFIIWYLNFYNEESNWLYSLLMQLLVSNYLKSDVNIPNKTFSLSEIRKSDWWEHSLLDLTCTFVNKNIWSPMDKYWKVVLNPSYEFKFPDASLLQT